MCELLKKTDEFRSRGYIKKYSNQKRESEKNSFLYV